MCSSKARWAWAAADGVGKSNRQAIRKEAKTRAQKVEICREVEDISWDSLDKTFFIERNNPINKPGMDVLPERIAASNAHPGRGC
jgi:hypothetical protein